jgi:phage-related minor tail protein
VSEYEHNEHLLDEIQRLRESNFHLREGCEELKQRIKRLEEALEGTVKWIVHLADSGDAGFWDVEKQSEIIAARAALKKESKP